MDTLLSGALEDYAYSNSSSLSEELCELAEFTDQELNYSDMLSGKVLANLLQILVQLSGASRILEIGTFTGYSALAMAEVLPTGGIVITCDMNERYEKIARSSWAKSPHNSKIDLRMGQALEIMRELRDSSKFDMIFIDADKNQYPEYYETGLNLLKNKGVMVVDNVLWSGRVLRENKDAKSRAIARTNQMATEDTRVQNVLLTVRDGIQLIYKK